MMSCKNFVWKIGPFVDGELPQEERDAVEAHLADCEGCRETALEFRQLDELAGRQQVPPVSSQDWSRLWEAVAAGPVAAVEEADAGSGSSPFVRERRAQRWLVPALAAAAVLLVGVFIGSNLWRDPEPNRSRTAEPGKSPPKPETMVAELEGVTVIDDEGGTIIIYDEF